MILDRSRGVSSPHFFEVVGGRFLGQNRGGRFQFVGNFVGNFRGV